MKPMFPFVQLEFAHAIGPSPGRYAVALAEDGERDVLQIDVVAGRVAAQGLRRRTRPAEAGAAPVDVPVVRVMWIGASQPLADEQSARAEIERLRDDEDGREELAAAILRVLNLAIRAHRAAAQDPYLPEITRDDPRAVRFGVGQARQLAHGEWAEAFTAPPPRARKVDRSLRLAPSETVAMALRDSLDLLESEELLLRARLDVDQERWRAATLQLAATLSLLREELRTACEAGAASPAADGDLALREDRVRALAELALSGDLDSISRDEVAAHMEDVAQILAEWRSPTVQPAATAHDPLAREEQETCC